MVQILVLMFSAIFIENFIFAKFMGCCPFLGVSEKPGTALGMGMAVTFVMTVASAVTRLIYELLVYFKIEYLRTIAFILVIAGLVQFIEMFLKRFVPSLYSSLGIFLPLITTNCAVLGVALTNVQNGNDFVTSVVAGFGTAGGFAIAIVILAGIREKMEGNNVPHAFSGMPITLITAGLMAIAFYGFSGLNI